jgi:hypothetical protein
MWWIFPIQYEEQIRVVKKTLQEINAFDKPVIYVFNKMDRYEELNFDWLEKHQRGITKGAEGKMGGRDPVRLRVYVGHGTRQCGRLTGLPVKPGEGTV